LKALNLPKKTAGNRKRLKLFVQHSVEFGEYTLVPFPKVMFQSSCKIN
jgi:hypothetical protein